MINKDHSTNFTPRENFLMGLLNRLMKEYKTMLELARRAKPLKIVEIIHLSIVPGETKFAIQLTNKNCVLSLTAAEIISNGYDLNDFNDFHANIITQAAQGKLVEFLKLSEKIPPYKISTKKFDTKTGQYIFTIETKEKVTFIRTADELSKDKNLLQNMDISDIYDIGYTSGSESILKEKTALLLAKRA